jgi:predicted anti-sigma-YlaC factor YlaD
VPTCRDMSELVTDYLERVVSLRTRMDMWWHLCRCQACRRYYDQMRRTIGLLGSGTRRAPNEAAEAAALAAARGPPRADPS